MIKLSLHSGKPIFINPKMVLYVYEGKSGDVMIGLGNDETQVKGNLEDVVQQLNLGG